MILKTWRLLKIQSFLISSIPKFELLSKLFFLYLFENYVIKSYGGTAPPTPKLPCFVLYLKIINIFLENNICIIY